MKITAKKIEYYTAFKTCINCENRFQGKICNQCGEKVFDEKTLTTKHFIHEAIDFFYHWESKVLKTIRLNFFKPGFVTKQNLKGIKVLYARPVQLYLVVAFVFFIIVSKLGVTDYIPSYGDQNFYSLSDYSIFKWAAPADEAVEKGIHRMWVNKGIEIERSIIEQNTDKYDGNYYQIAGRNKLDSISLTDQKMQVFTFRQAVKIRQVLFNAKVATYGKVLVFVLIPLFALLFYLLFYKKLKYYGASLILATHFMVYNLCYYIIWTILNVWPANFFPLSKAWMMKPFYPVFYNSFTQPISEFVFGSPFEFIHILFFMSWLYLCFELLFALPWWKNVIASYFLSRIFFFLIFGVLKKFIIAYTVWSLHY